MGLKVPKRYRTVAHRHAPKQEKRTADRLGAVAVRGSGCGDVRGDSRITGVARVENKCTLHDSFRVTMDMIDKVEQAAMGAGEVPVMEIEFVDQRGKVRRTVAVMPTWALDKLLEGRGDVE